MSNILSTEKISVACSFWSIQGLSHKKIDMDFIQWAGHKGVPIGIILTKCDKQSKGKTNSNFTKLKNELLKTWEELPPIMQSSSTNGTGKDDILNFIEDVNKTFQQS